MNDLNQAVLGVLTAFLLGFIVFGSTALAMVENASPQVALPPQIMDIGRPLLPTLSVSQVEEPLPELPLPEQPFLGLSMQAAPEVAANVPTIIETSYPKVHCSAPSGWSAYILQPDDSIDSVSIRFGLTPKEFSKYNCLIVKSLQPGSRVYVPRLRLYAIPTATAALTVESVEPVNQKGTVKRKETQCGPPAGWVVYIIKRGDTLFGLSLSTGASISELQFANCMGSSTILRGGQAMYAPRLPVSSAKPSATHFPTATPVSPTPLPSKTLTPPYVTPRATSTAAPPKPTNTATPTATLTQEPTKGSTSTPTQGGVISPTATRATPTHTPVATATPLPPTSTPIPTATPLPTNTPIQPTDTPLPTNPPPPTDTPLPPTDPPPPTDTPAPPTDPPPPTDTPAPIIDTQATPTDPPTTPISSSVELSNPGAPHLPARITHNWASPWYYPLILFGSFIYYRIWTG